jgi:RNA polymerase sigma-70 factor (ECF subfamily)
MNRRSVCTSRRGSSRSTSRTPTATGRRSTAGSGKNPEQLAANSRLKGRLQQAMRGLPPSQRAIVFLREMQGLSTREVAHVMGISEDNVKTRLSRARKSLQTALEGPAR